jgi:hypothetical protein
MGILDSYKNLYKGRKVKTTIKSFVPSPNQTDYDRGYIRRYFAQMANDKLAPIYEVSESESSRLKSSSVYRTVNLRWRIKGPLKMIFKDDGTIADKGVEESNRKAIELVSDKMPALKLYLVHLLQFYKE